MSDSLPSPRADRIHPNRLQSLELRRKVVSGESLHAPTLPTPSEGGTGESTEPVEESVELRHDRWWQYMPSEAQLMEFLSVWLKRKKSPGKKSLRIPLATEGMHVDIPVSIYYQLETDYLQLWFVDQAHGVKLPGGFVVTIVSEDPLGEPINLTYLSTFHPLPTFPLAVMSFVKES